MKLDWRTLVLAIAFLAIGFLVAERMTPASAAPAPRPAPDYGQAFSGTTGTVVVEENKTTYVIIVRDSKLWRVPVGASGSQRPWVNLAE